MKGFVLNQPGNPLELVELPDPVPGPDEVIVKVEACGVCHSDLHLADGDWTESLARRIHPTILGHEVVGTVVARGPAVGSLEVGRRVGVGWVGSTCGRCPCCLEGDDNLCEERKITGVDLPGGYAESISIKASQAVAVPDGLTATEAAPLFCAGVTVYRGMKKATIRPGQRVAIFGIGGLGHLALQLARMWYAETIGVDLAGPKLDFARELGARHVVSAVDASSAIQSLGFADVAVVTAAAARAYEEAFKSLRKGGTLVVVGLPSEPLQWLADDIATREIRIVGSAVGSRRDQAELLEIAAKGKIRCAVETMPLADANVALGRLRAGDVTGRLVLTP